MIVKEIVKVLKEAKEIMLYYGSDAIPFDRNNPISLDAFGKYVVDEVRGISEDCYEVTIAMRPVKEGEAG